MARRTRRSTPARRRAAANAPTPTRKRGPDPVLLQERLCAICNREGRGFCCSNDWRRDLFYRFCSMGCMNAGVEIARKANGMIDKTAREKQALKEARQPFAEALTKLGLMEPFFHRTAADIDTLIEAVVTGYVDSMQRQAGVKERTGITPDLNDEIPF